MPRTMWRRSRGVESSHRCAATRTCRRRRRASWASPPVSSATRCASTTWRERDAVTERVTAPLSDIVAELTGPTGPETRFAEQVVERRVEFDALVELLLRDATPGVDPEGGRTGRTCCRGGLSRRAAPVARLGLPIARCATRRCSRPTSVISRPTTRWTCGGRSSSTVGSAVGVASQPASHRVAASARTTRSASERSKLG